MHCRKAAPNQLRFVFPLSLIMKNSLLMLAGAAALSLASCSQEKTTETTTAAGSGTTTTTTTTIAPESEAVIEARAQRIADKMVANMKITDEATKTKIRTVYVNRAKRMDEIKIKYAADTTGMAAALRDATATTDSEFKVIFVDPTQYQAYQSSRPTYDDSNYMNDNSSATSMSDTTGSSSPSVSSTGTDNTTSGTDAMTASKMKAKAEDGSKIKVKENGKVKIKDADGTKVKY